MIPIFNKGEIERDGKIIHRGEIISETATALEIETIEGKTVQVDKKGLNLSRYTDEHFEKFLTPIKNSIKDKKINSKDEALISESTEPHIKYLEIRGLRDLGFRKANSIKEVSLSQLKTRVKAVINAEVFAQLKYIAEDDDLDINEKKVMTDICETSLNKYLELIKTSVSLKEILDSWPAVFTENKQFNSILSGLLPI